MGDFHMLPEVAWVVFMCYLRSAWVTLPEVSVGGLHVLPEVSVGGLHVLPEVSMGGLHVHPQRVLAPLQIQPMLLVMYYRVFGKYCSIIAVFSQAFIVLAQQAKVPR